MRYTEFDQVFDLSLKNPYDRKTAQDIEAARSSFDGVLFIDRVLKALGITKGSVAATFAFRLLELASWC